MVGEVVSARAIGFVGSPYGAAGEEKKASNYVFYNKLILLYIEYKQAIAVHNKCFD
jgi:hypothetical protein